MDRYPTAGARTPAAATPAAAAATAAAAIVRVAAGSAVVMAMVVVVVTVPAAWGEVYVQNDQMYIGDDGSLHVVGEITNGLDMPLSRAGVDVTLFDGRMQPILTAEAGSLVNTIMPGMRGPFDLVLTGGVAGDAASYGLDLHYSISGPKSQVMEITESEMSRDGHNNVMITGMVANRGEITANTVAVVATLYDGDGRVAAVSRAHPEPDYLRAEGEAFFLVTVPDKIHTDGVDRYSVVAESEEYAAVPEFPAGSAVLLVATLSAYIGVARYAGGITTALIPAASPR